MVRTEFWLTSAQVQFLLETINMVPKLLNHYAQNLLFLMKESSYFCIIVRAFRLYFLFVLWLFSLPFCCKIIKEWHVLYFCFISLDYLFCRILATHVSQHWGKIHGNNRHEISFLNFNYLKGQILTNNNWLHHNWGKFKSSFPTMKIPQKHPNLIFWGISVFTQLNETEKK